MAFTHTRIRREKQTIRAMIRIYCRAKHHTMTNLCDTCRELYAYADNRLDKCPYQRGKTTCVKCPTHCYTKEMKEKVRTVMRYAGPRMAYLHPVLTAFHFIDSKRKVPFRPAKTARVKTG